MAGDRFRSELAIGREGDPERFVDPRHLHGLRMEHEREHRLAEALQQLLALAQRIAEEDGDLPVVEGIATEVEDIAEDLCRGRKAVAGQAEGALHDDRIGLGSGAGFSRLAGTELEIPGVEERFPPAPRPELRRAENMARRIEPDLGLGVEGIGLPVIENGFLALSRHPQSHQPGGPLRTNHRSMRRGMIGMGMGDKGPLHRKRGIEPQIDLGKKNAAPMEDLPAHSFTLEGGDLGARGLHSRL